jgi:ATP-binding cassette subfamily B multidrug efflux pump
LQESISAVREVQAFNRADENIENFKEVNAANRDANVRAVAFTSALAPTLEALSYVGLGHRHRRGRLVLCSKAVTLAGTLSPWAWSSPSSRMCSASTSPSNRSLCYGRTSKMRLQARERIFTILDEKPAVFDKPGAKAMTEIKGLVEFDERLT